MDGIKLILFLEFIAMFVCGLAHIFMYLTGHSFPLSTYLIVAGIVLVACLLVLFVFAPLAEWLLL